MDSLSLIENKQQENYDSEGKRLIKTIESQTLDRCPDCDFKMDYCDKTITFLDQSYTTTEYCFLCKRCDQNTFVEITEGVMEFESKFEWNMDVKVYSQKSLRGKDDE